MLIVSPYLAGYGPTVEIDTSESPSVVSVATDGTRTTVFQGSDYYPASGLAEWQRADDVVSFALAYVERPEEFDRAADDLEQIHREWWIKNGDALSAALAPEG